MILVRGSARPLPGRRQELLEAAIEVADATREDDGCLHYEFYADLSDPALVVNVEVWRDQAALDAHLEHAHTQTFLGRTGPLLDAEPEMTVRTLDE